jgi:hypothetical protein
MIRALFVMVLVALVQLFPAPSFASCPDTHYPCGNACCSK